MTPINTPRNMRSTVSRETVDDDDMASPHENSQLATNRLEPSSLKPFRVTVIDRHRKRTRYLAIARSWHDAWLTAANEYGLVALISVRPAIRHN